MPESNRSYIFAEALDAEVVTRVADNFRGPDYDFARAGRPVIRVIDLDSRLWGMIVHGTEHGETRWAPARGNGLLVCAETLSRLTQ